MVFGKSGELQVRREDSLKMISVPMVQTGGYYVNGY